MKRTYERPVFLIETFVANQVVATACESKNVNLDTTKCFIGPMIETENVLLEGNSSCTAQVKFMEGAKTAYHPAGGGMVGNTTYTAPSNAVGLIVWCATMDGNTKNADQWNYAGTQFTHAAVKDATDTIHKNSQFHCHVAPVYTVEVGLS